MLFDEELSSLRDRPALSRLSILVADLDKFKVINDTLGHHVGDRVLVIAADRLRRSVRPGDMVARLGGDEFAILLPGATRADAAGIVERMAKESAELFIVEGKALRVRASIGMASGVPEDAETLLREADASMYAAKHSDAGAATGGVGIMPARRAPSSGMHQ
jgi:diguanylate cyclase (GGDEF)-like protein